MSKTFQYPEGPLDRGKVLDQHTLARIGEWGRYKDVDGDGIPYRTIPGVNMPAYFTRGSGHNEKGQYSERPDDYVHNMDRLARKFETAKALIPAPEIDAVPGAAIGIIAYGTSHSAVVESRDQLAQESGVRASYLRLRAYPFTAALTEFIDQHQRVYVVEQNRDGQMLGLMRLDLDPSHTAKLRSVRHYSGLPIDARSVSDDILIQEGLKRRRADTAPVTPALATGGE
jgi:2-oxoglutarate ferredoxin oxidoreductase subunit alpha